MIRPFAISLLVFAVAVWIRLPACWQSLWVDELHTAWCIADGLTDVAPRAILGNQSPIYFWGLWCWQAVLGDSEEALRLSSGIAVAATAAGLTGYFVRRGLTIAGLLAGGIVAVESNSVFFGTELRPYAAVIAASAIAVVMGSKLIDGWCRSSWIAFNLAALTAFSLQPTSIGLLAGFHAILLWRYPRDVFRLDRVQVALGLAWFSLASWLWVTVLATASSRLDGWRTFAVPGSLVDLWTIWPWLWLVVIPAAGGIATAVGGRPAESLRGFLLLGVAVVGVVSFWLISWFELVPVWQRRYMVAWIPLVAVAAGEVIATGEVLLKARAERHVLWLLAGIILGGLVWDQGHTSTQPGWPERLAYRGEDWRSAARWVTANLPRDVTLQIDAGLIEASTFLSDDYDASSRELAYLECPLSSLYRVPQRIEPVLFRSRNPRLPIIVRAPASAFPEGLGDVFGFGGVSVVVPSPPPN